jgi:DNA-binding GntR family transcriptional regulator
MTEILARDDLRVRKPPPLSEIAYDKIKFLIITLQLEPGSPVVLEHLVSQLGVSRTPIRDAIVRLQGDGFIEVDGDSGSIVAPITPSRIVELFQVREPLECLAVRLATPQIEEAVLRDLSILFDGVESDIQSGEYERYFSSDTTFHQAIVEAANNRWLRRMLQPLSEHAYRIRQLAKSRRGPHIYSSHQEHCRILAAMRERDGEGAEGLMAAHIRGTAERIVRLWSA